MTTTRRELQQLRERMTTTRNEYNKSKLEVPSGLALVKPEENDNNQSGRLKFKGRELQQPREGMITTSRGFRERECQQLREEMTTTRNDNNESGRMTTTRRELQQLGGNDNNKSGLALREGMPTTKGGNDNNQSGRLYLKERNDNDQSG
ncbi:hypothetical protein DPMN_000625, partial [Dreissena polymorpha]